ncbi:TPA: hypothetical protein ACFN76_002237, partial [Neisseria meningitidis]
LFGDFGDGAVAGQVLDVVSFALGQLRVAHGNLSCRKGRMLPHTGLFLLGKVALQMRIRRIPTCRRSILFGREQQTIFLFPIHWYADG